MANENTAVISANFAATKAIKSSCVLPEIATRQLWLWSDRWNETGTDYQIIDSAWADNPNATLSATIGTTNPTTTTPSAFGGNKPAIYHNATARPHEELVDFDMPDFSMYYVFSNANATAVTAIRTSVHFQMDNGQALAFYGSYTGSKMAVQVSGVVTTLNTTADFAKHIILLKYTAGAQTLDIYVDNVLDKTITGVVYNQLKGTMRISSNATGSSKGDQFTMALLWNAEAFTDAKRNNMYTFLNTKYS